MMTTDPLDTIVGDSPALRSVLEQVDVVASTDATILVTGESGTGKELIARAVHRRSRRAHQPLVKVNCSAFPRDLFESEFFGHARGSFTGALRDRPGRFQLAHRGTIFLDEVGDLPLELQPKLLRVLQEGEFERVGDDTTNRVDVRVVAATNRDLEALVCAGRFREDLFYRLNVVPIELPPLRDRRDDIPRLAAHFVAVNARRLGVPAPWIPGDVREQLLRHEWPGNIRELENVVQRAVILSRGSTALRLPALRERVREPQSRPSPSQPATLAGAAREHILAVLRDTHGVVGGPGGAAVRLGVKRTTLQSMMRRLGIEAFDVALARGRETFGASAAAVAS